MSRKTSGVLTGTAWIEMIILDADSNEQLGNDDDLADVVTRLEPVAKSLNCVGELAAVADTSFASYQRQRRASRNTTGGLRAVVPMRWWPSWKSRLASWDLERIELAMFRWNRRCCPTRLPLRIFTPLRRAGPALLDTGDPSAWC